MSAGTAPAAGVAGGDAPPLAELAAWLNGRFLPCWAERVIVPGRPGYAENFRWADGRPLAAAGHTTMVTGRLIYSFSLAHRCAPSPASLRAADHGVRFLLDTCRLEPGRFAHHVGAGGEVSDPHGDLYDLAFVLLGLGGYSAATGRTDVLAAARAIGDRLDRELTDPEGGYREPLETGTTRMHYPHMHLFEAFQMLAAADPQGGWRARAEAMVDLVARLVGEDGALDERFGAGWQTLEPERRLRETGHHFEWAWLLFVHGATTGSARASELGWRLYDFGRTAAGVEDALPDRPIPNTIDLSNHPVAEPRPLWPTMELAKASLAAAALGGGADHHRLSRRAIEIVLAQMNGRAMTWANSDDSVSAPDQRETPARTLYHLVPSLLFFSRYTGDKRRDRAPAILQPF